MNAYEIPGTQVSLPTVSKIDRYRFVTLGSDGNAKQAVATSPIIGVSRNNPDGKNNQVVDIADGFVMIEAAGTIVPGAYVKADANGKAVTSTEATGCLAITGGDAGVIITIKL